ncbi:MAG: DM13 domain-containing protein [Fimbriimonadaceae bacterium]|nr:DM13 domain-containing protein [Fimbriimonadaceae bacterium]
MNIKKIALLVAIPVLAIGWYLFHPELLFVNKSVNEGLPAAGQMVQTISQGSFQSYAHETKGIASVVESDGKKYLRLSEFSTSNGPDVRVYLVKGSDSAEDSVKKNGYVELGKLKGNIGDQNYHIPDSVNLDEYKAVSIWCARFSVGFGGATLSQK